MPEVRYSVDPDATGQGDGLAHIDRVMAILSRLDHPGIDFAWMTTLEEFSRLPNDCCRPMGDILSQVGHRL